MPVRAVLLDLDNTLLQEDAATLAAVRATSERAAARIGGDATAIASVAASAAKDLFRASPVFPYADEMGIWWGEALWGGFVGDAPGLRALRAFVPAFRLAVWKAVLGSAAGSGDVLARELVGAFIEARRSEWAIDPAAMRILDDLASRYRLALVTNGASDVQREKVAATGLARYFAATVISAELGIGKPDRRIFAAALDAIGASARDAVMVGDSIERDVVGAHAAGIRAVWIDRDGAARDRSPRPDAWIAKLSDLPAALGAIEDLAPTAQSA
jgi:putative hydrolase of the HAD superfamily